MQLEEDLETLNLIEEENSDERPMLLKKNGRFDSSACLIVPNEYRITPHPESISEISK